jgi:hypothetical protein
VGDLPRGGLSEEIVCHGEAHDALEMGCGHASGGGEGVVFDASGEGDVEWDVEVDDPAERCWVGPLWNC